jgi:hypothetical protein
VADERDKIRAMMGLPSTATKDPVVVGGTPFGQAGTAQAPQTPMSYGGTSFGQAGSAAPTASNEYESVINEVNKTIKDAKKTLTLAKKSGNKKDIAAAQSLVDLSKGELSDLVKLAGSLGATGGAGIVNPGYQSDADAIKNKSTGTSNTGKNYINGKLATPEEWSKFLYGDQKGSGAAGAAADGAADADARKERQSAFDLLKLQFDEYGLGALVEPLRGLIQEGISPSEFAVRLRQTEPYKKRFAANAARISKGLRALSESDYINLEDDYQTIMRNYGLPASYYTKGELGRQEGFEKFIGGDVSPAELEERIVTAQKRVLDAAPEVTTALKQFYPDIKNGEILAYTLDPEKGLADIRKKVTAAEIGGAALGAQLGATVGRAEELARYGVTAESARAGYGAIGGGLERGRQLADIYQQPDYTQAVAEEEVFNLPGQAQAGQKRKKIIGMEKATFGGQTGITSGALSRDRAGSY